MSEMSSKTTVAVSEHSSEVLQRLKALGLFDTELAAFLATASLAVAHGLPPKDLPPGSTTKWNKGSGDISIWSEVVPYIVSVDDPLKSLERYGEAGLQFVALKLNDGLGFADIYLNGSQI